MAAKASSSRNAKYREVQKQNAAAARETDVSDRQRADVGLKVFGGQRPMGSTTFELVGVLRGKREYERIAQLTRAWEHYRIPITVHAEDGRVVSVTLRPPTGTMLLHASNVVPKQPHGSIIHKDPYRGGDRGRQEVKQCGDVALDDVLSIAKTIRPKSMAKAFAGTVKEVLGTAHTMGLTVQGRSPIQWQKDIVSGDYLLPDDIEQTVECYLQLAERRYHSRPTAEAE